MRSSLMKFGGAAVLVAGLTVGATQIAASSGEPDAERPAAATEGTTRHERLGLPAGTSYAEARDQYAFAVWLQAMEQAKFVAFTEAVWADYQASLAPRSSGSSGGGGCTEESIIARESGGDPGVYNTSGSGASGLYQFMPGTWDGYGGYANAADAPPEVQQQKFNEVWAGGAGSSHWSC